MVRKWHKADMLNALTDVCFSNASGATANGKMTAWIDQNS